jgi:CHAD domain-containing protein
VPSSSASPAASAAPATPAPLPGWRDVRRAARKELADAALALSGRQPIGDRIHGVRTATKKVRALARLIEPVAGRRARKVERRLRALAKMVSGLRDAEVLLAAFDRLLPLLPDAAKQDTQRDLPLRVARAEMAARFKKQIRLLREHDRESEIEVALREVRRRVTRWRPERGGPARAAVMAALIDGYRRARKALAGAVSDPSVAAMHGWRRAVKRHRYQLRVFEDARPAELGGRLADLDKLGDQLGEAHDLALLETELGSLPRGEARRRMLEAAARRRRQLRAEALLLGRGLFGEKPKALAERITGAKTR